MPTDRNTETARKILAAALSLWSEKGYADSTMRELARRLGMGTSSLYFYFASKEEIVSSLYESVNDEVAAEFHRTDTGERDLGRNLARYLTIKLAALAPLRACLPAILKEAVDPASSLSPVSRDSAAVLGRNLAFFEELAARSAMSPADAARFARLLWVLHIGVVVYWLHDRSPGAANAASLVERTAALSSLVPMMGLLPGADELFRLLGAVLEPPDAAAADVEVVRDEAPAREVDVVVVGAGPIGLLYALFLKQRRPRTSILVVDKAAEAGHKIGESTLSGFCKALRSVGIRHEVQQRLFYPKNGLGFLHVTEATKDLTRAPEYVLETFDETFQVERRVLDGLIEAQAVRQGIQVVRGATVSVRQCRFSADGDVVVYEIGPRTFRVKSRLVVDASGPAGVLSRALGLRTDRDAAFQTGSVWSYWSGIQPLAARRGWVGRSQFPRDHYTEHLCFREGWVWYIPIVSWQATPTANLRGVFDHVLGTARGLPSREELEEAHAAPTELVTSIGLSLRMDRDGRMQDDPRGAFEHYTRKYPAFRQLLAGGRLREDPYGPQTTFQSRLNYRGRSAQLAGDGWLLVGDAAFFVDPLISPGLTGGTAGAWHAAQASVAALDQGRADRATFAGFERAVGELHAALERDNELVYLSFDHPELLALVQRFQEIDARRHFHVHGAREYGLEDTNVWGILAPEYQALQRAAWTLCREAEEAVGAAVPVEEQTPADYEDHLARMRALLGPYVESHRDLTPYVGQNAPGRPA